MSIPTTRMTTSAGYVTSDCLSEEYYRRNYGFTGCGYLLSDQSSCIFE